MLVIKEVKVQPQTTFFSMRSGISYGLSDQEVIERVGNLVDIFCDKHQLFLEEDRVTINVEQVTKWSDLETNGIEDMEILDYTKYYECIQKVKEKSKNESTDNNNDTGQTGSCPEDRGNFPEERGSGQEQSMGYLEGCCG